MHDFRYRFKTGTAAASTRLAVMSDVKVKDALQRVLSREHLFLDPTRGKTVKERGTRLMEAMGASENAALNSSVAF